MELLDTGQIKDGRLGVLFNDGRGNVFSADVSAKATPGRVHSYVRGGGKFISLVPER